MYTRYIVWFIVAAVCISALGGAAFLYKELERTKADKTALALQHTALQNEYASSSLAFERTVDTLKEEVEELREDYADLEDDYDDYKDEYGDAIETAKDLAKLATIDKEVLKKYSKANFLNENYVPKKLKEIDDDYVLKGRAPQFFAGQALPFLEDMLEEADKDGIDLRVLSAYRSFDHQSDLKGQYIQQYGSGANTFSADQGFSEHQLGTAVDFAESSNGSLTVAFERTEAFEWMEDNAYRYGFVLSYPKGNQFYIYEPWHWRFVGEDLAKYLHRENKNFYDLDQREIDEYLLEVFD